MMFVAGETQDIANETAALVEQIVREQIIHIASIPLLPSPRHQC
jgi:hypothetical protein